MPINTPSRCERFRLSVARFLVKRSPIVWLATKMMPKDHPARTMVEGTREMFKGKVDKTFVPRRRSKRTEEEHRERTAAFSIPALTSVVMLVLSGEAGLLDPWWW